MSEASKYELAAYADPKSAAPVFRLRASPEFTPLDVNVAFLAQTGWNQSVDLALDGAQILARWNRVADCCGR